MTENANPTDDAVQSAESATADIEGGDAAAPEVTLESLQATADENWARYMRTAAEMENLRKRAARDLENARKYGNEKFAGEMLNVKDSLELGLAAAEESATADALQEGTQMTLKLLEQTLAKFGVTELNPTGEVFNPQLHEAMAMLEAPDSPPNTILQVLQKGYQINGRLLRPARVIVAKA